MAQQDQERLKSMTDSQLTSLHQTRTVTLNSTQFTVISTASFIDANGNSSCTSNAEAYFKLSSTVTSVGTADNPGQNRHRGDDHHPAARGNPRGAGREPARRALSGAASRRRRTEHFLRASATTDHNGCVAFAGLPTDTYTISATDPGYVDPNGNATATETVSVNQTAPLAGRQAQPGDGRCAEGRLRDPRHLGHLRRVCFVGPRSGTVRLRPLRLRPGQRAADDELGLLGPLGLDVLGLGGGTQRVTPSGPRSPCRGCSPSGSAPPRSTRTTTRCGPVTCEQEQPLVPLTGTGHASVRRVSGFGRRPDGVVDEPSIDVAVK